MRTPLASSAMACAFPCGLCAVAALEKRAQEALRYNALVQSWHEVSRLARESGTPKAEQTTLFGGDEA